MAITQRDIDKKNLSLKEYIAKYYSQFDLTGWNYWINNTINKAWDKNYRDEFLKSWGERMEYFDFNKMEYFYQNEDLSKFDEDVKKFLSFLSGDGFFIKNKITFKDWLNILNFTNPLKPYEQDITINEVLNYDGGMNFLRSQLMNLVWWRQ